MKTTKKQKPEKSNEEAPDQGYLVTVYDEYGNVVGGKFVKDREFDKEIGK